MAVIVAGHLIIKTSQRAEFIKRSKEAIAQARQTEGCEDFSVSEDPIDENRVNVFELWSSQSTLEKFRGSGPEDNAFAMVDSFNIKEYDV